jgi:NAD(P)-dependent dehydrogenase (short-subunit alcohol dehydrogenase family)
MSTGPLHDRLTPMADLLSLHGQVALVSDGAQGLGFAVSRRLREAGARVAVTSPDAGAARAAADRLGSDCVGVGLDLTRPDAIAEAARTVESSLGPINILINNAELSPARPTPRISTEFWTDVLAANLSGTFQCSRAVARRMLEGARLGVVVNVCSIQSSKAGYPQQSFYSAAKHGLAGLSRGLALEFGPSVRVLGVATNKLSGLDQNSVPNEVAAGASADGPERPAAAAPSRSKGAADQVACVVLFAASRLATSMTGSLLIADSAADGRTPPRPAGQRPGR